MMAEIESSSSILVEKTMLTIDSEKLAYWYFRLNGFLTIENFVVHPDSGSQQRTDIDIIGARFPHRTELPENENPMQDDERLKLKPDKIRIILAEVKRSTCDLNPAWTNPDKGNMPQIISALGAFERETLMPVSEKLYEHGWYENRSFVVSFCCLGRNNNQDLYERFPEVPQLTWDHVLSFIYDRFDKYEIYKRHHQQWDNSGKQLWECAKKCSDVNEFLRQSNSFLR